MKKLVLLLLSCLLAACNAAASPATSTSTSGYSATKLYQLTAEMLTVTANQPKNDTTITAIIASKQGLGTAMAETMTAMPTFTLTPTIPPDSPACQARDLQAAYMGPMGATQSIAFGVNLTNVKGLPCYVQVWPQAVLVDPSGNPLDVKYQDTPMDTPIPADALLGLPPGRTAGFTFQWGNWCMPAVQGGVSIHLTFPPQGGFLTIPTSLTTGGVCNDPGNSSWMLIFPITMP